MSFRFFATPTVVFRSSRLGEDFSKFPESSYRSSKKKTENCANHDSYPSPRGGVKEWFGSLSIQLPSSKLQIPDSCLFFQVPAHLHTFIFLPTHNADWLLLLNDRKSCKLRSFCAVKMRSNLPKKKDWLISCGCVRCPQGSFSEYYIFFPPTRDLLLCMSPQKSIFPDSSLFMLFLIGIIPKNRESSLLIRVSPQFKKKSAVFFVLGSREAAKCRNHVTSKWLISNRVGWTS